MAKTVRSDFTHLYGNDPLDVLARSMAIYTSSTVYSGDLYWSFHFSNPLAVQLQNGVHILLIKKIQYHGSSKKRPWELHNTWQLFLAL